MSVSRRRAKKKKIKWVSVASTEVANALVATLKREPASFAFRVTCYPGVTCFTVDFDDESYVIGSNVPGLERLIPAIERWLPGPSNEGQRTHLRRLVAEIQSKPIHNAPPKQRDLF